MNVSLLSPLEPIEIDQALGSAERVIAWCRERLSSRTATLRDLAADSAARKQRFLEEMCAVDVIPSCPQRCQQIALSALASGLVAGALDATVAVVRHELAEEASAQAQPSFMSELLRHGAGVVRARGVQQKRAARDMVATSTTFPLLASVMAAGAWRDFVSTVFALGYGFATTDAALILLAHQAPAADA